MAKGLKNKTQEYRDLLILVAMSLGELDKDYHLAQSVKDRLNLLVGEIEEILEMKVEDNAGS